MPSPRRTSPVTPTSVCDDFSRITRHSQCGLPTSSAAVARQRPLESSLHHAHQTHIASPAGPSEATGKTASPLRTAARTSVGPNRASSWRSDDGYRDRDEEGSRPVSQPIPWRSAVITYRRTFVIHLSVEEAGLDGNRSDDFPSHDVRHETNWEQPKSDRSAAVRPSSHVSELTTVPSDAESMRT